MSIIHFLDEGNETDFAVVVNLFIAGLQFVVNYYVVKFSVGVEL